MADCVAEEVSGRAAVAGEERRVRAAAALACAEAEESAARHDIEAEELAVARVFSAAQSKSRAEAVEAARLRAESLLAKCAADEEKNRRLLCCSEQQSRTALSVDRKLDLKTMSMFGKRWASIVQDEALSRRGAELDEKGDRALLDERHDAVFCFLVAPFESSQTDARPRGPASSALSTDEASARLQRIGRGYLLRKKLQRRLLNRCRDLYKQGVIHLLAGEFTQRREIVGEEYLARQGLVERLITTVPAPLHGSPLGPVLQDVLEEEEKRRNDILDDYAVTHDAIERAEHKQFLKHSSIVCTPEASDSSDEEDNTALVQPEIARPADVALSELQRESTPRRRYKGFELDALGRFLLDYENDLNRMQMELADFRRQVAFEHDQVKDTRDRAAQEVVRGGTGAMWVPARPLPLSDLVRGPSVQYGGKRRS
ncbi:hypothetical protein ABB37_10129 [Leptomonas pyrrhocoris]|uniref:Uncharacterized protein n=1 Tax=Leptomonas pyrrhocoris TaxID=157538 RepID=A0A0N0DQK1_LEPPY|nr:hypothetical protein ABB37_10129 [Leptomonas pyrrhocoris]KPA73091.1 hypothetical protein ABB37_10129 [Leptomonas pyrrhocoris]|eukprot:XP_015651530.1 hypothetical protein ABB37_10129 [Leptomonas pyrrhocoris]